MSQEWFALLCRGSLLMLLTGSCVALLSRFFPMASPRWYRFAWGAVLLQGLMLIPVSLTVEAPRWIAEHVLFVKNIGESSTPQGTVVSSTESDISATEFSCAEIDTPETPSEEATLLTEVSRPEQTSSQTSTASDIVTSPAEAGSNQAAADVRASIASSASVGKKSHSHLANSHKPRPNHGPANVSSAETNGDVSTLSSIRWTRWPTAIWLTGVIALLSFGLVNYVILNIALLKARPARRSWAKELQDLSLELNLDRSIALDVHPVIGPLICWTPAGHRIVVPIGLWSELSSDERQAVLHHELSHLRRGDLWKSLLARLILALHWFNPLAWISARRFDESAEWACDALMASERPARVTQLANALLAATTAREGSPILALSATGGPLFQRIRRLVSWDQKGDTIMQRLIWSGLLSPLVCLGVFELQFAEPAAAQSQSSPAAAAASSDEDSPPENRGGEDAAASAAVKDIADRILVNDQENLKKLVALMKTPTGQIVMADRAAMHAQNAASELDEVSQWQQFVTENFRTIGSATTVNADSQKKFAEYIEAVSDADADVKLIGPVLKEIAAALDTTTEPAQFLQRFLNHQGAPVFIYMNELRSRLHPRIEDLSEVFSELLVRNKDGQFVIRPARRKAVEDRLKNMERLQPMLKRFHDELTAWSEDLANLDKRHGNLKTMLADPNVAVFLASRNLTEDDEPNDEHFDDHFYMLEEATDDAPSGLVLNTESEQLAEIESELTRFSGIQQDRSVLEKPLQELINRLDQSDDLHVRLKEYLSTDIALMIVVREMDYSPITADDAAREWLGYAVTKVDDSKYMLTSESPEDVKSRCEDFFRVYRELRRRGRTIDEFASQLEDKRMAAAIQSLPGKLLLQELVERTAQRPDVDGLQLWVNAHFEETAEGLKLQDWAGDEINNILTEAAELEEQLSKTDF